MNYGTVAVNNTLTASHTQSVADASHTFSITNGTLKVDIPNNAGNGTEYVLNGNALQVNNGFSGSVTAMYEFTNSNVRDIDFEYDHNDLRTRKTVTENGVATVYDYTLHGKLITHMTKKVGNTISDTLHFFYDKDSRPAFVKWNNVMYRYIHNLQGDIVGILDTSGNLVVEYKYDAWGKPLSTTGTLKTTLGALNPFRYRGYVYDAETDMYYLLSRYYTPETVRFINADAIEKLETNANILGYNAYTYCVNQPIIFFDPLGEAFSLIGGIISGIVNVATTLIAATITGQKYSWMDGIIAFASGFVNGIPLVGKIASGAISGIYTYRQARNNGFSREQALLCGVTSGVAATLSIGNLGAYAGIEPGIAVGAAVDLVFGTGYNSISAAVYAGTKMDVEREIEKEIVRDLRTEAARKEQTALKKGKTVKPQRYGGYRNMQMELSFM